MAREIDFKVNVETEASVAELRKLKQELRDIPAGTEEFTKVQARIDDIQDSLAGARAGAGNFLEVLGTLPGPIGTIGSAAASTVTALKQFTLIKFSDLGKSVAELGKDFLDIGKNILNLTGITKVYTVINATLEKSFIALGIAQNTAATASKGLAAALTATGIGAIVVAVGLLINAFNSYNEELKESNKIGKELAKVQSDEAVQLQNTLDILTAVNGNRELQNQKIEELKKLYPGFNAFIDKENKLTKQGVEFVKLKIKQYELEAKAKLVVQKIAENGIKIAEIEQKSLLESVGFWETAWNTIKTGGNISSLVTAQITSGLKNQQAEIAKVSAENDKWRQSLTGIYAETEDVLKQLKPYEQTLISTAKAEESAKKGGQSRTQQIQNTTKAIEDYIKVVKKAADFGINEIISKNVAQLKTARETELKDAEDAFKKGMMLAKKNGEDTVKLKQDYEQKVLDISSKYSQLIFKATDKTLVAESLSKKTAREKELDEAEKGYNELLASAKKYGLKTEELTAAYAQKVNQINSKYAADLTKQIGEYIKTSEDLRKEARQKELDEAKRGYDALLTEAERLGLSTEKITESYNNRVADINKKYDADEIKSKQEFNDKVAAIRTSATADEAQRNRKEREDKYNKDLADLEADKNFIKLSEEEKGNLRVLLKQAYTNDIKKIDDDARKDDNDKVLKKYDDELRLLELRGQNLLAGTKAYFENRAAILAEEEAKELAGIDLTEQQKTAIKEKYSKLRQQLDEDELASYGRTISATIDAISNLTSAIASGYDEEAKTSEEAFNKRKKLQKATALLSAASGLVQILTQPSTLPSPFDWIVKGINAAALAVATAVNIKKIDATKFDGGGSASTSSGASTSTARPALPSAPTIAPLATPQIVQGVASNPTQQIAQSLAQTTQKPVQAYVVSTAISSQQSLDRRTNRAATL
jgi:hypothetical protein